MPRGTTRVLRERPEAVQKTTTTAKTANKTSTRSTRGKKKMDEGHPTETTTTKKRRQRAATDVDTEKSVPPPKRQKGSSNSRSKGEPKDEPDKAVFLGKGKPKEADKEVEVQPPDDTLVSHHSHLSRIGQVMVLGQGDVGQLGLGDDIMERKKPAPVSGDLEGKRVVQVVCGGMHTVALTDDGKVFTWGCNDEGALGRVLEEDGEYSPGVVDKLDKVKIVQVSAGDSHTAALESNGSVYCWGVFRDSNGPFGLAKPGSTSTSPELVYSSNANKIVKISSGSDHVVMLTEKGEIFTVGCAEQGQLGRIPECFSSRGGRKGIQTLLEPQIVRFRKLKGSQKPKFLDVFCGSYHTFALTQDKNVYTWGLNNYGQLGTGDVDNKFQPEMLPTDWIKEDSENSKPTTKYQQLEIAGGQHHTVICHNGHVYVCGRREYGRLGLGENNSEEPHTPTKIADLCEVESISTGSVCSFAVTKSGDLYAWGMGTNLQLGTGEEEDVWSPVKISGKKIENKKIVGVSSGGQHSSLLVSLAQDPVE